MKEKRQLYIDKEMDQNTKEWGYAVISRHESGLEYQLSKVFHTLKEAKAELQHCADLRKDLYDVEIVDLMIM